MLPTEKSLPDMIAKAEPISHGANAIRYSVNKDRADIVKVHLMPEGISPDAMYQRMMLHCKQHLPKLQRGSPMTEFVIRIELSPSAEESRNWKPDDWRKLADEFIRVFDSIDLSKRTKRKSAQRTNLQNSQYVVALHRDSKSGILHLHIDACRMDKDGGVNNGNLIGTRATMAANIINGRRGWVLPETIGELHKKEISDCCMGILREMDRFSWSEYAQKLKEAGYDIKIKCDSNGKVCGYSIRRGNSTYKASKLGVGRNLAPSKIMDTWEKLHPWQGNVQPHRAVAQETRSSADRFVSGTQKERPVCNPMVKHYDITTRGKTWTVNIPEAADAVIRQECSLEDAHPLARMEEIQHTALLLFAGYLDAATSMAESSGGGGNAPESGWCKEHDEDDREWARRCARVANTICKWSRRKGLGR